jgi:hypothetical protein
MSDKKLPELNQEEKSYLSSFNHRLKSEWRPISEELFLSEFTKPYKAYSLPEEEQVERISQLLRSAFLFMKLIDEIGDELYKEAFKELNPEVYEAYQKVKDNATTTKEAAKEQQPKKQ